MYESFGVIFPLQKMLSMSSGLRPQGQMVPGEVSYMQVLFQGSFFFIYFLPRFLLYNFIATSKFKFKRYIHTNFI